MLKNNYFIKHRLNQSNVCNFAFTQIWGRTQEVDEPAEQQQENATSHRTHGPDYKARPTHDHWDVNAAIALSILLMAWSLARNKTRYQQMTLDGAPQAGLRPWREIRSPWNRWHHHFLV